MKNKILAFVMVMAMALTMIPGVAMAAGAVAKVGETEYTDIQEAIKAAAPSGTVELLSDVTVPEWKMISETLSIGSGQLITIPSINGLTIDGKGHTLNINSIESAGNGGYLFYDATKLNIKDLTIKYADGVTGGIGLTSGTIENVTFDGGVYGVLPGSGDITISGCTFKTNGSAIYYETDRDNLKVTNNTFETNVAADSYAIIIRGKTTFTGNKFTKGGGVNVTGTASGEISGNDFGDQLFRVYSESTATISDNTINNLVFRDDTKPNATFEDNTLSDSAKQAIEKAGVENTVTTPTPTPKPATGGYSGPDLWYVGGNTFGTTTTQAPSKVEIDGVAVPFTMNGSQIVVGCVDPGAKWVTVRWNSTSVTTNFTPDGLVECSVSIPKTGDMPVWAAVLALFGF